MADRHRVGRPVSGRRLRRQESRPGGADGRRGPERGARRCQVADGQRPRPRRPDRHVRHGARVSDAGRRHAVRAAAVRRARAHVPRVQVIGQQGRPIARRRVHDRVPWRPPGRPLQPPLVGRQFHQHVRADGRCGRRAGRPTTVEVLSGVRSAAAVGG